MLESTRIHKIMEGVRGEPASDINATVEVLQRISQLVTDFPEVLELDVNPLFVFEESISAVDVKITLDREKVLARMQENME